MRLSLCIGATLLGVCVAWTNVPLPQNSRNAARFWAPTTKLAAATLTAPNELSASSSTLDNDNEDTTHVPRLYDDSIMTLLEPIHSPNDVCLEEMTSIFLSPHNPPGSLSWDVLDTSHSVLHAWSKTNTLVGAQVAHSILKRILLEQECAHNNKQDLVTTKHFGMVVEAYNKADDPRAAEQVLSEMKEAPNRIILNSIVNAWAKRGNTQQALRVFEQIASPTRADYNSLLSAYAKCGNARQAERVLRQMVSEKMSPDLVSYNCVLDSWAKSGEAGAADRALAILTSLKKDADAHSYSSVVNAYIQEGNVEKAQELLQEAESVMDSHLQNSMLMAHAIQGNAQLAEDILQEMESQGVATTVSYNTVMKAWKQSDASDMAQRAEGILGRMVARELDDVFSYNTVIGCYTKSRRQGSAEKAEHLLQQMMKLTLEGRTNVRPNIVTINVVLDALAKSGQACRAEQLLTRIEQDESNDAFALDGIRLNAISYTCVIDAYAKSKEKGAAQRAEAIFKRMESAYRGGNEDATPTSQSFNAVINAWAQSGAAERAEEILTKMEESFQSGDGESVLRPDVVSYSIVMNAWSKSDSPRKLEKTFNVFQRMCNMYKSGNEAARPNHFSFVTLVDAIVKSGEQGAAERAHDVLLRMHKEFKDGNVNARPNARLITSVMKCYGHSGSGDAGEKAEELLNWMFETSSKEDNASFRPNEISFNVAINAWARARVFGKSHRAKQLLDKMIRLYEEGTSRARPNTFVFTAVLNACGYAVGDAAEKANALEIATSTFNELRDSDYGEPNHVTYVAYITAIRNLLPEGHPTKAQMISNVFRQCCRDGQVNELTLSRMSSALPDAQVVEICRLAGLNGSEPPVGISDAPAEWTRNVVERKSKRSNNNRGAPPRQ